MWWLAHDLTLHTRTHTHMPNRAARRTATTHAHPGLAVHTRDVYSRTCSSYAVRARRAGARRGAPSRTRCGIGSSRPSQKPWAPSPKGRRLASGDERGERFFLVASSKIEAILIQSILNYDNLTFILQENASRNAAAGCTLLGARSGSAECAQPRDVPTQLPSCMHTGSPPSRHRHRSQESHRQRQRQRDRDRDRRHRLERDERGRSAAAARGAWNEQEGQKVQGGRSLRRRRLRRQRHSRFSHIYTHFPHMSHPILPTLQNLIRFLQLSSTSRLSSSVCTNHSNGSSMSTAPSKWAVRLLICSTLSL